MHTIHQIKLKAPVNIEVTDKAEFTDYGEFVDHRFKEMDSPVATLLHAAVGISGEAGEIIDQVKKAWAYNQPLDVNNLIEELGDLRFYYEKMLAMLGITDHDVKLANMTKLYKRYPDGYSDLHAQARLDKAESITSLRPEPSKDDEQTTEFDNG